MNFGQLLTAMVTPFDESGNINFPATKKLLEHLIATGTEGVVVAGTTGESPTLTHEEKLSLFSFVVEEVNGRIPVIAGTGTNDTRASVEITKEAEKIGVDGIMLVAPYYNRPSQDGLYAHFKANAEATNLPVMIYNIPSRTGCNVEVDTIVKLSEIDNVLSVKEASGNLEAMAEIIERTKDSFLLYSGDDSLTLPTLSIGGHGIVSVSAHVVGSEMQEMIRLFGEGKVNEASKLHRQLLPIFQALFSAPNPTPVKAVLNMNGISVGDVRLPLVPLSEEQAQRLGEKIQMKKTKAS